MDFIGAAVSGAVPVCCYSLRCCCLAHTGIRRGATALPEQSTKILVRLWIEMSGRLEYRRAEQTLLQIMPKVVWSAMVVAWLRNYYYSVSSQFGADMPNSGREMGQCKLSVDHQAHHKIPY